MDSNELVQSVMRSLIEFIGFEAAVACFAEALLEEAQEDIGELHLLESEREKADREKREARALGFAGLAKVLAAIDFSNFKESELEEIEALNRSSLDPSEGMRYLNTFVSPETKVVLNELIPASPGEKMRYFIVYISAVDGGQSTDSTVKVKHSGTATAQEVADGVAIDWFLELDGEASDRHEFYFQDHSMRVKRVNGEDVGEEVFNQNDYLSEVTVTDEDIRRAKAYRNGEPASEWWGASED